MGGENNSIPLIGTALNFGASMASATNTEQANMRNQQQSVWWYNKQRQDALSDWHMQNTYNSPEEEVKRYEAAGLNPALMYGGVGGGGSAGSVDHPSVSPAEIREPDLSGIANIGSTFYDLKSKKVSTDNLKKQGDLIDTQAAKEAAQKVNIETDTAVKAQNLEWDKQYFPHNLDARILENTKRKQNLQLDLNEDERRTFLNATTIAEKVQAIKESMVRTAKTTAEKRNIEKNWELLNEELKLKKFDVSLTEQGIRPQDPYTYRIAKELGEQLSESGFGKLIKSADEYIKDMYGLDKKKFHIPNRR